MLWCCMIGCGIILSCSAYSSKGDTSSRCRLAGGWSVFGAAVADMNLLLLPTPSSRVGRQQVDSRIDRR